jgi:hypothetical protein
MDIKVECDKNDHLNLMNLSFDTISKLDKTLNELPHCEWWTKRTEGRLRVHEFVRPKNQHSSDLWRSEAHS